jgi:hypothetical protein
MRINCFYAAALALGLSCLVSMAGSAQPNITVSGTYKSYPIKTIDSESGDFWYDITESASYTLKAVLPLRSGTTIDSDTVLTFMLGDGISFSTEDAKPSSGSLAARKLVYTDYEYNDNDQKILVGTLTLTWNASALTVSGNYTPLWNKDAFGLTEMADFSGYDMDVPATVKFSVGEGAQCMFTLEKNGESLFSCERFFTFTGSDARTFKVVKNSMGESEAWESHTITCSGTVDFTPPTLTVTSPAVNSVVTSGDSITVKGTASDASGVSEVCVWVEYPSGEYSDDYWAEVIVNPGTLPWAIENVEIQPGTNIIYAYAMDLSGNETWTARSICFQQWATLSVVTNGPGTIAISGMKNGKVMLGSSYKVTLTPQKGYVLADWACYSDDSTYEDYNTYDVGWSGSTTFQVSSSNNPVFKATFIPNPFANLKGSYTAISYRNYIVTYGDGMGDVLDLDRNSTNLGMMTFTVTSNGVLSGKWVRRAASQSFTLTGQIHSWYSMRSVSGVPDITEWETNMVCFSADSSSLSFDFYLDINDPSTLSGEYYSYLSSEYGYVYGNIFGYRNRATSSTALAGTYNIGFLDNYDEENNQDEWSTARMGYSFATATVANNGAITMKFTPADGVTKAFSMNTAQAEDGSFIFFSPLYSKAGLIAGWLTLTNGVVGNLPAPESAYSESSGTMDKVIWAKPAGKSGTVYASGFTNYLSAYGTSYNKTNVLNWTDGSVVITSSTGEDMAVASLTIAKNKFTFDSNENSIGLTFAPATGVLSGSFMNGKKKITVSGMLIEDGRFVGFFNDANAATGWVTVEGNSLGAIR